MNRIVQSIVVSILVICIGSFTACVNSKAVAYFPQLNNDTLNLSNMAPEPFLKKNDLLSIAVSSPNPEATTVFNISNPASSLNGNNLQPASYLIDSKGMIQFPLLGNIRAEGLTKDQLKDLLTQELDGGKYLVRPLVTIRQLNFTVTVLGEVAKPSVINVPSERISLMEAIGLAGDITIYGKKDNVLLIREENNKKISHRLNLNSNDVFTSDFYYLKPNDIVYVEPKKTKVSETSKAYTLIPIITAVLTLGIVAVTRY
jgi:polysaccharide export outer membrane protein